MDSGYYAAVAGLVARTQDLDIAASNLSNAQTPGYRAEREYFRSVLLGPGAADSQLGQVMNNYGVLGGDQINLAQGTLERTSNPLDLAIEGEGFFAIQTAQGVRYTRNGSFHRTPDGKLAAASGDAVLSSSGQPIPVPPGEVSIGTDGSLSVDGGVVATLGAFTFPKGTELKPEGADRYRAPEDVQAQASKSAVVHQGSLESANQDTITASMNLILIQREAEMMQKALSVFHTEFNKIASEELPRI
jgi:flagellar basal-body rod protein FlgF/flagellar basal-body rod protein FlgG